MYSTCLFCNKSLGANRTLETFPVGRRIAFDPARGRLWVVCRGCERWNLSPIEERWEIVEQCEREFRDTRIRTSTENIGLARLAEGLELVRIGTPMRPEFAAWRYGDQFGRRRRRAMLHTGVGLAVVAGVMAGASAAGIGGMTYYWIWNAGSSMIHGSDDKVVVKLQRTNYTLKITKKSLEKVHLVPDGGYWALSVPDQGGKVVLEGEEAHNAVRLILPVINRYGGSRKKVGEAVSLLERSSPEKYVGDVAHRNRFSVDMDKPGASIQSLSFPVRLALEMATHEESERRALEGELALLEQAWRHAEEIADISDNLLLPPSYADRIKSMDRPK